jgi:iron(III) transport system substrate-binding protein
VKRLCGVLTIILILSSSMACTQSRASTQSRKVVAYTAHEDAVISQMAPKFERDTGYTLEFVKLSSSEAIARLAAEAATPRCDVIWSISGERLQANAALLEAYVPREWKSIAPVFKVGTNWLPYTCIVDVLIVNTRLLSSELVPRKWEDLADAKWRSKICSATPDKSGSAYTQMYNVLLAFPREGWDIYRRIVGNFFVSATSDAVSKYVNDGEAPIGITLEDNAYRFVQGGGPVQIIYPTEGVLAVPDGIAIVKGAPHPDAAKVFIDWCLSLDTQKFLVQRMYRRPVRMDCGNPPGLPRLEQLKVLPYDFRKAASNMGMFLQRFAALTATPGS